MFPDVTFIHELDKVTIPESIACKLWFSFLHSNLVTKWPNLTVGKVYQLAKADVVSQQKLLSLALSS